MKAKTNVGLRVALLTMLIALMSLTAAERGDAFCFEEAGTLYGVPPGLLWAIAKVESDFDPQAIRYNADGTYDYGVMQINSRWEGRLGPSVWASLGDPCTNVKAGSRILSNCIKQHGYNWEGVGCYNAISPNKRAEYARSVNSVILQMHEASAATASPK